MAYNGAMPTKQKFNLLIEPGQLRALKLIEERTGARLSEQIRRAIDGYLQAQTVLSRAYLRSLLKKRT